MADAAELAQTATAPATPAPVQAPAAAPVAAAPVAAAPAAPASQGLPKVTAYELPLQALAEVASTSGLQWVNSDAAKIADIQAAMAAEAKPVHVPRERPVAVAVSEGPLVLVETKRDLSELKLPFEGTSQTP